MAHSPLPPILQRRHPGASLGRVGLWHAMHFLCYGLVGLPYASRAWGIHRIPLTGPVLIVSNHQSFLDPILIGLQCHHRQFYALARATLFRHAGFGRLLRMLNAFPVDQQARDFRAIRGCIDVLKDGQALLLFPEGQRTLSGKTERFLPGTMMLVKRAKPTVLPVAVTGTFEIWKRGQALPRLNGRVGVMYGEPIPAEDLLALEPGAALEHLRSRVEAIRLELRERVGRGPLDRGRQPADPPVPPAPPDPSAAPGGG